jgi:hypothetical protein
VPCIQLVSMTGLLHLSLASARTSCNSCHAQGIAKGTACLFVGMCCLFNSAFFLSLQKCLGYKVLGTKQCCHFLWIPLCWGACSIPFFWHMMLCHRVMFWRNVLHSSWRRIPWTFEDDGNTFFGNNGKCVTDDTGSCPLY